MSVAVPEDTQTEIEVTTIQQPSGQRHPSIVSAGSRTTTSGSAAQASCGGQGPHPVLAQGSTEQSVAGRVLSKALAWLAAQASKRSS